MGCAKLLEAAGVTGVVGGVRSALFWCFARMDVWGGFLGETKTKNPDISVVGSWHFNKWRGPSFQRKCGW